MGIWRVSEIDYFDSEADRFGSEWASSPGTLGTLLTQIGGKG